MTPFQSRKSDPDRFGKKSEPAAKQGSSFGAVHCLFLFVFVVTYGIALDKRKNSTRLCMRGKQDVPERFGHIILIKVTAATWR